VKLTDALNCARDGSIAVRIIVAPIPVISVHSGVRSVELTVSPVLCRQVAPVRAIFAIIPVMVVAVVSIVVSDVFIVVTSVVLISGLGDTCRWGKEGSSQE
jgi:hypothetical protein